jgi:hypothetical protein
MPPPSPPARAPRSSRGRYDHAGRPGSALSTMRAAPLARDRRVLRSKGRWHGHLPSTRGDHAAAEAAGSCSRANASVWKPSARDDRIGRHAGVRTCARSAPASRGRSRRDATTPLTSSVRRERARIDSAADRPTCPAALGACSPGPAGSPPTRVNFLVARRSALRRGEALRSPCRRAVGRARCRGVRRGGAVAPLVAARACA